MNGRRRSEAGGGEKERGDFLTIRKDS